MGRNWTGIRKKTFAVLGTVLLAVALCPVLSYLLTETWGKVAEPQKKVGTLIFYDKMGMPVHHIRDPKDDYRYFFPVSIGELPQHLLDVTIAAEDRHFYKHDGVDFNALLRATWQLLKNRRIVSGASTITMQLMSMQKESASGRHTLGEKIRQIFQAKYYEKRHGKREILEQYLNALPYGGKIYGIEAAARYYFGMHAKDLNLAEVILLSGLPQAPSKLRPDRHPERAQKRFRLIVDMLEEQKYFSSEEAEKIRKMEIRYRDFSVPFLPIAEDSQYFQFICQNELPGNYNIYTHYDAGMTEQARTLLLEGLPPDKSIRDAAMVIVENATGAVPVMIGTLDFKHSMAGQVNAAIAYRPPGSLFKPFLFGEAIDGGIIVPQTILEDSPFFASDYLPENFSGTFHGNVPANIALANSYNIPAIRILQDLGVPRMEEKFVRIGLIRPPQKPLGLTLALGSANSTLLNLSRAYSALTDNKVRKKLSFTRNGKETETQDLWTCKFTGQVVLQMLRTNALPRAEHLNLAWKTGTSNGYHDAWCIAVSPEYTVAVWYGNKVGKSAAHLVGARMAAPVAGAMMANLHQARVNWQQIPDIIEVPLCEKTGLRKSPFCDKSIQGTALKDVPLRQCEKCRTEKIAGETLKETKIRSPQPGVYRASGASVEFVLDSTPASVHLYIDGTYTGIKKSGDRFNLPPGSHTLVFLGNGPYKTATMEIRIKTQK